MSDIEREEFEQAVADKWPDSYKFTRFGDEDYYDEVLEGIWQGWQARRQALEGEAIGFLQSSGVSQLSGGHPAKLYPIGATPSPFESSTLVYTHPASRKVVEGEVAGLKAEIRTERDPSDEYDSFLVFVSRGKSEPYLFIPETLDDAILDEVVKRINTHPASAATLQFGNGNLVVTGGSFDDVPAVFISPAIELGNAPGTALSGKDAERRTDMLYGDETVLLFKTAEHASVVVGALIRGNDASADKWIKCSEQRPNVLDVWIKMTDGSVVACWSQLDGDFYWNGGGSESYILENTVTHWKPRQQEQDDE